ncbi:hypothetical protein ACK8HX_12295 [Oryzobacter sp. R7]|uniref:hypothetical protein n=1 Tax=Oryzobacter faecalis TaxID=3388656 RepID=UPI00398D4C3C
MKPYSDLPVRRTRQVLADLLVVAWVVLWVWVGGVVHDAVAVLAGPGRELAGAGSSFRGTMTSAGDSVDDLPLLDDRIAEPFRTAAGAGAGIEEAGNSFADAVETSAVVLGVVAAAVPIVLVVLWWLVVRVRFARRAGAAQRSVDGAPDLDLFALRAMANQPMERLARVTHDPAGAWRRGEPDVVRALAVLELRECGIKPPPVPAVSG